MDREAIKRQLTQQFEQSLEEAIDAVEQAPDGRWIAASEWQIREIFQRLMHATARCCFGEGTQAAMDWAAGLLSQAKASDVEGMLGAIGAVQK